MRTSRCRSFNPGLISATNRDRIPSGENINSVTNRNAASMWPMMLNTAAERISYSYAVLWPNKLADIFMTRS